MLQVKTRHPKIFDGDAIYNVGVGVSLHGGSVPTKRGSNLLQKLRWGKGLIMFLEILTAVFHPLQQGLRHYQSLVHCAPDIVNDST